MKKTTPNAPPKSPPPARTKVGELYGLPTGAPADWRKVADEKACPFSGRTCSKNRKSDAQVSIGTCTMLHGRSAQPMMICPVRLLERRQVFHDCRHLLKLYEPGDELRIVPELSVPGGSIDYCLVAVRDRAVKDFVAIEFQTLDTTGTVWPERQRFLRAHGVKVDARHADADKPFGMNWKMTGKTILVQMHHKVKTLEHLCKHLVLVTQDALLAYMRNEFNFGHIRGMRNGDSMHFHSYRLDGDTAASFRLELAERISTSANGMARCLDLKADPRIELDSIVAQLTAKLPRSLPLDVAGPVPIPASIEDEADEEG